MRVQELFYGSQIFIGVAFIATAWFLLRPKTSESGFRVRESELRDRKIQLQKGAVKFEGRPHELLGVPESATESEIQKAFRERMKRFHPDRSGKAPGTRDYEEAERVTQLMIQAKDAMLRKLAK